MKTERYLPQQDAAYLNRLAEQLLRPRDARSNVAERLIDLIDTCILLPETAPRTDCVALHSRVTYRIVGSQEHQTIFIAYPQDAHESLAHASILAPIPMALLGRAVGSIVEVHLPFNQVQFLEIVDVEPSTQASGLRDETQRHAPATSPANL